MSIGEFVSKGLAGLLIQKWVQVNGGIRVSRKNVNGIARKD